MIFAETENLYLRKLESGELPRLVQMLDVWDTVRWLVSTPFPYTMRDAENFYEEIAASYACNLPSAYALALKGDNLLIGIIGLHAPRIADAQQGEVEIGYWVSQDFCGRGLATEATREVIRIAFDRPDTRLIGATTSPNNLASQKVLRKAGLRHMGVFPRSYEALRGDDQMIKWQLTRAQYEQARLERASAA